MNKKTALVTGASSGIGFATANSLIGAGYKVYAAARRVEKMAPLKAAGAAVIKVDVTQDKDIQKAIASVEKEDEGVDVLVNNAGFGSYGAVEDTKLADARYQFEVNLFGLAAITKAVLPYMRRQKSGSIVNISSMGGRIYTPLGAWYHATKHALEGWSDCLRVEVEQFGIDVIVIQPGVIRTEFPEVMEKPMLERSGNSAYGKLAKALAQSMKIAYEEKRSSPPQLIADTIVKALAAKKPKTRYAAGKMAKPLMFFRKHFGDLAFDKTMMAQFVRMKPGSN